MIEYALIVLCGILLATVFFALIIAIAMWFEIKQDKEQQYE